MPRLFNNTPHQRHLANLGNLRGLFGDPMAYASSTSDPEKSNDDYGIDCDTESDGEIQITAEGYVDHKTDPEFRHGEGNRNLRKRRNSFVSIASHGICIVYLSLYI